MSPLDLPPISITATITVRSFCYHTFPPSGLWPLLPLNKINTPLHKEQSFSNRSPSHFVFNFFSMNHYTRNHIPAFGSWDFNDNLQFTQCFESARQAGLIRCSYSGDRDLYVAGDLYENNIVTPAIIVAPRRRRYTKEAKKAYDGDVKEPPSPVSVATPIGAWSRQVKPKAVDEDLYKISPELLRAKPRRKRWGLFSSCIM